MNIVRNTVSFAMKIAEEYINEGDICIDATAGKGSDTERLCTLAGEKGHVYAFDIQKKALDITEKRLEEKGFRNFTLIHDGHENMSSYVKDEVSAVIFNLGYLPEGDKNITTAPWTTMKGIGEALDIIKCDGIVVIVMYQGHEEGKKEKEKILSWAEELDKSIYHCAYVSMINQKNDPPEILFITKKK